ncbi:ActS/PrrB/RegB family redox-sensitive histidine kinase [Ahrensia marina]|uniref:ActS/PrrB/RegB family redox-sensitive histidine kinase n=1 Tax=Ahrensia marina TaxID=1514904 RepID=UPI0035CEA945
MLTNVSAQRVRLDTLVRLRWLAIAGQLVAVCAVAFGFGYPLPIVACLGVIGLSALLNLYLWWGYPRSTRISDRRAAFILAFDQVQLASLLYLTGGLGNPFAVLLLAPVLISATILRLPTTVALGLLVSLLISALALWHMPLPWAAGQPPAFPLVYRLGVWAALLVAIGFICTYAWNVAHESRNLANALAAAELALEREQHLSELDGMAAAAAHELGTPLGTITVVAKEISREIDPATPLGEDIALIQAQAERCRTILGKLSSLGVNPDTVISTKTLDAILDDLVAPHRDFSVPITVTTQGDGPSPMMRANPALSYGIGNLIENAIDFASQEVCVKGTWDANAVTIRIEDDGPGFPAVVMARLGEPYVSRRRGRGDTSAEDLPALGSLTGSLRGDDVTGGLGGGLGLGFFIAKTLLERSGAEVKVGNGIGTLKGASVIVSFAREQIDLTPKLSVEESA